MSKKKSKIPSKKDKAKNLKKVDGKLYLRKAGPHKDNKKIRNKKKCRKSKSQQKS